MSKWTKIVGSVWCSSYYGQTKEHLQQMIYKIMEEAPDVTGSEGNARRFATIINPYLVTNDENYTEFVITTCGELRDRTLEETNIEYARFLIYLNNLSSIYIKDETHHIDNKEK